MFKMINEKPLNNNFPNNSNTNNRYSNRAIRPVKPTYENEDV